MKREWAFTRTVGTIGKKKWKRILYFKQQFLQLANVSGISRASFGKLCPGKYTRLSLSLSCKSAFFASAQKSSFWSDELFKSRRRKIARKREERNKKQGRFSFATRKTHGDDGNSLKSPHICYLTFRPTFANQYVVYSRAYNYVYIYFLQQSWVLQNNFCFGDSFTRIFRIASI